MSELPKVGQIYRDTCGDKFYAGGNRRTIEVVEALPNGIKAKVLTNVSGDAPKKLRMTTLQLKTLRACYELQP